MSGTRWCLATTLIALGPLTSLAAQHIKSARRDGPHGLVGWTLDSPFPDRPADHYPRVLIISQNGRLVRRIQAEHYIWNWIFWADGHQVAYEDGPPHFMMRCILADLKTGKTLEDVDCFRTVPDGSPAWLTTLEKVR